MRICRLLYLAVAFFVGGSGCKPSSSNGPRAESVTLGNGLRVVALHVPGSTNVAIFTYLPMGLASDGPQQSQWAHLVEHLVIRSTVPAQSMQANAETLPDHMRLDFYGSTGNWQDGLKHHADWLAGIPFTQENLTAEKPKVIAECDFTTKNFATHKFAMAAWSQGYRHGQTNVALKGDVLRTLLSEIQKHRDDHFTVLDKAVVCVVSGVEPEKILPAFSERLGAIKSSAKRPAPVTLRQGNRDMTWDLDARHLVLTWPIPDLESDDYSALMVAGQWLTGQFYSDPELQKRCGMVLAGADLTTPEGNFFYVSASLRPGATLKEVRDQIEHHLQTLRTAGGPAPMMTMFGKQLAGWLTHVADPNAMKGQLPPNMTLAMVEMNLGLQWGMNEFRYGARKATLAKKLAAMDTKKLRQAVTVHLASDKTSVITLRPATSTSEPAR